MSIFEEYGAFKNETQSVFQLPARPDTLSIVFSERLTIFRGVRHRTHQNYKVSLENNARDT